MRRIAGKVSRKEGSRVAEASDIYRAGSQAEAPAGLPPWKQAWEHGRPRAAACVERDLENLLSFFAAPESHWQKVRTTNVIERAFREVRRRTRPCPASATWALEPYAEYFRAVKNLSLRETKSHEADKSSGGYDANP